MTIVSTAATTDPSASIVADFAGGESSDVSMMIGIGLVKDSDAVFFRYIGDKSEPHALVLKNGKPLTRMQNIAVENVSIADDIGDFNATKLNLYVRTCPSDEHPEGRLVLLTAGLNTYWSQCVVGGLMALYNGGDLTCPFTLDTWKGDKGLRPCFAAIRVGTAKMSDNDMYAQLCDARSDRDATKITEIMRDAIEILGHALKPENLDVVDVSVKEALTAAPEEKTVEAPADF